MCIRDRYNAFAKLIVYFVELPIVGTKDFLILIVVMLDKILVSVSSIKPVSFEYLKIVSNDCKVVALYSVMVVITFDLIVSAVLGVFASSNLTLDVIIKSVVSGSIITGVTEATEYFFKSFIILSFVASVRLEPLVGSIER